MLTPADMPNGYVLVVSTSTDVRIEDAVDRNLFIDGTLELGSEIVFDIRAAHEDGTRGTVSGKVLFGLMMQHFGAVPSSIRSLWTYGTNLAMFNKLTAQGWSKNDAAGATWSGIRAREYGFGVAVCTGTAGSVGYYGWVEARFTR